MRAFLRPAAPREGTRVGSMYGLSRAHFSEEELATHRARLMLQPRVSFGVPPPPFQAWHETADELCVPRFYGLDTFGPAERDDRVDGVPIALNFEGTLTEVQERATAAAFGKHLAPDGGGGVLISLPCGFGKTVWAVSAVCRLGRKACVVVHKGILRDQWQAAFERFCPGVRVGHLQGKKKRVLEGCDVVIAMVLTLAKSDDLHNLLDEFGVVVVDECHHMAAPVMNLAMRGFRARHVVGLTATKHRPDGLTPLLHMSLGPEGFHVERDGERVRVSIARFVGGTREILTRDNKPMYSVMINQLARNPARNAFLADRIAAMRRNGRVIMVLSDRLAQLDTLRTLVVARGIPEDEVGFFVGKTPEAERALQLAKPVVLCSYDMANEGVDKREADTCVMATPKGRVTQCIGRVQRPCETKQLPLVLDVADDVAVFASLRRKREREYRKERYDMQTLDVDAPAAEWFA